MFARIDGDIEVVTKTRPLPAFDLQIPLLSLPYVFHTDIQSVPAEIPYLMSCDEKTAIWRDRLGKRSGEVLVGIAWKGSGDHQRNRMRSPGLAALTELFESNENIRLVSLQKEGGAPNIARINNPSRIEDYTAHLHSFDDTAALVSALDMVIAPDTAVAHLAGALGVRTFLMLPMIAEWRWLQNRCDSPWYPATQLFRQQTRGDWSGVIGEVIAALCSSPREAKRF